jgi:hypothetical protein
MLTAKPNLHDLDTTKMSVPRYTHNKPLIFPSLLLGLHRRLTNHSPTTPTPIFNLPKPLVSSHPRPTINAGPKTGDHDEWRAR